MDPQTHLLKCAMKTRARKKFPSFNSSNKDVTENQTRYRWFKEIQGYMK